MKESEYSVHSAIDNPFYQEMELFQTYILISNSPFIPYISNYKMT